MRAEVEERRMYNDVVGADCLGMPCEIEHRFEALIGARHHDAARFFGDGRLGGALSLFVRHGVELALLAVDEDPGDAEVAVPVAEVPAPTRLVEAQLRCERCERCRPDATQMFARVGLGIRAAIFHGESLNPLNPSK